MIDNRMHWANGERLRVRVEVNNLDEESTDAFVAYCLQLGKGKEWVIIIHCLCSFRQ